MRANGTLQWALGSSKLLCGCSFCCLHCFCCRFRHHRTCHSDYILFQGLKWDGTVRVCLLYWTGRRASLTLFQFACRRAVLDPSSIVCSWCWMRSISWIDDCGPLAWCFFHRLCVVSNQFESKASNGVQILDQPPNCHYFFLQFVSFKPYLIFLWVDCCCLFIFFLLIWVVLGILSIVMRFNICICRKEEDRGRCDWDIRFI